jgi:hypothetical protein
MPSRTVVGLTETEWVIERPTFSFAYTRNLSAEWLSRSLTYDKVQPTRLDKLANAMG